MIRHAGHKCFVRTFNTKNREIKWAQKIERKLEMGDCSDYTEASKLTLGDLFKRYKVYNKDKKKNIGRMKKMFMKYKLGK